MVLFFQAITLNVSINSYSNALLTLLVSNQFVEIKSAVFKKFEKENLFQLACADVLERFQLFLYLFLIGFRNLNEVRCTLDWFYIYDGLLIPLGMVFGSEILVDWLKHSFITKFNHIRPDVYSRFIDTLTKDFELASGSTMVDQSPIVSRRIGFSSLPLVCLFVRIVWQTLMASEMTWARSKYQIVGMALSLILLKLLLGIGLLTYTRNNNHPLPPSHVNNSEDALISNSQKVKNA